MDGPIITAAYLPAMGMPALCIDQSTHAIGIERAEQIIDQLTYAILRARVDAKKLSMQRRHRDTDAELATLIRHVDVQLATPETFPFPSPASEVTP